MPSPANRPIVEAQKTPKLVYVLLPKINESGKRFVINKYITTTMIPDDPNSPMFKAF